MAYHSDEIPFQLNWSAAYALCVFKLRKLIALLGLSSWCLVVVGRLFLAVPWGCLRFVIVVFPDHTHLLFSIHSWHKAKIPILKNRACFAVTYVYCFKRRQRKRG